MHGVHDHEWLCSPCSRVCVYKHTRAGSGFAAQLHRDAVYSYRAAFFVQVLGCFSKNPNAPEGADRYQVLPPRDQDEVARLRELLQEKLEYAYVGSAALVDTHSRRARLEDSSSASY
ncbi:unnamed protein product [Phytophthora fragariaefolia]|uniref:Unnamed protein product n=1 Tax=Phytophthora fragariaefolia TaxID=1490495 RepID=A0A9W6WR98_9STRA|nr:unnamed protein product [Phytophthora fragariaefolia]